jgi:FAD dependent oxidoreductase TIGR03364
VAERRADVIVVGAGVLGLAHAYHAARLGKRVVVLERSPQVQGASVRNFGLVWPIGQPSGFLHQMALRSRELWIELLNTCKVPYQTTGSMHVCYREDEEAVGKEFCATAPGQGYTCEWLNPKQALDKCDALNPKGLRGAVYSALEFTMDVRSVMTELPRLMAERYRIEFHFSTAVLGIELPKVRTSGGEWRADSVIVCNGDDFETLYQDEFKNSGMTRTKLQMMRTVRQPDGWKLGPALAAGLTFRHYPSFRTCASLEALKKRVATEMRAYDRWGIHVLVSQTPLGELTIGDSHEHGQSLDFVERSEVEELILTYMESFLRPPAPDIAQRWHGFYARHPEKPFVVAAPAKGVLIITGTGGSGLTLSLGLAERITKKFFE